MTDKARAPTDEHKDARLNPGPDEDGTGGAGANPAQHRKIDRELREQAGTQRDPEHPEEK